MADPKGLRRDSNFGAWPSRKTGTHFSGPRAAALRLSETMSREDSARLRRASAEKAEESEARKEKYRRIAEHRRYPKKERYSWEELATGLTAMQAGVNRYYAMHAGAQAKKALDYLAQAAQTDDPAVKAKAAKLARKHLAEITRERHPELAEQIESRILWEEGHRPETWDGARNAPRCEGPSINPNTGAQEFAWPTALLVESEPSIPGQNLPPLPGAPPSFGVPPFLSPNPNAEKPYELPAWPGQPPIREIPNQQLPPPWQHLCTPENIDDAKAKIREADGLSREIANLDAEIGQSADQQQRDILTNKKQEAAVKLQQMETRLSEARALLLKCTV